MKKHRVEPIYWYTTFTNQVLIDKCWESLARSGTREIMSNIFTILPLILSKLSKDFHEMCLDNYLSHWKIISSKLFISSLVYLPVPRCSTCVPIKKLFGNDGSKNSLSCVHSKKISHTHAGVNRIAANPI